MTCSPLSPTLSTGGLAAAAGRDNRTHTAQGTGSTIPQGEGGGGGRICGDAISIASLGSGAPGEARGSGDRAQPCTSRLREQEKQPLAQHVALILRP